MVVVGVALCLLVLAFTSSVDAAFINISRHRLNTLLAEGQSRARVVSRLMNDPYRFKATIILLNVGATIAATAFTLYLAGPGGVWWQLGGLVLLLVAILVLSEALPKALVLRNPDATALRLARPISMLTALLWPLIWLLDHTVAPFTRMISGKNGTDTPLVTEEELRTLMNVGEEEGLIEHEEREMIEGIFSFGDTLAREVMVPRVNIVSLDADDTLDTALALVIDRGHSRIPVYRETIDQVVGLLYAKDLLAALRDGVRDIALERLVRPAYYVPETMKVDALLRDLQARKVHMAIIVDEYGGTAGLVTIEDLIEEIVGEIQDEYDTEERLVQTVADGELLVDALVPIADLNELTGIEISSDESDRIGGFVYERLGRVPTVGDVVELHGISIEVLSVQGLRPRQLRIRYQPQLALEISSAGEEAEKPNDEPT
ncbi:MAG: HlyC/CorC family transporter [Chloroflexales bacterium]|nr:HlyC/CorC family transporter [Chloroflexales bacterium]